MAAPRGGTYVPRSGALAGLTFTGTPGTSQAYNRYQQARAHSLGFASYSHQRNVTKGSVFKGLLTSFFNKEGRKPSSGERENFLKALGERQREEAIQKGGKSYKKYVLDVDFKDHSKGGSYDLYLQRIGRRTGNEDWNPGETP